jgi:hypothetical protein
MNSAPEIEELRQRNAPIGLKAGEFREIGHRLVDELADRLASLPNGPVTRGESPTDIRNALGTPQRLPANGRPPICSSRKRPNQHVLTAVEKSGEAFLSNAVIGDTFLLRACIVNFHTALDDVEALIPLLSRLGKAADNARRQALAV